jgi:hypothetical protein
MTEPYWKMKHDWIVDDIAFEMEEREFFKNMLQRHSEDEIRKLCRRLIKTLTERIKRLKAEYEKVYGFQPRMSKYIAQRLYGLTGPL